MDKACTELGKAVEALLQQPLMREYRVEDLLRRLTVSYRELMLFRN